jgi:hypothetical protein
MLEKVMRPILVLLFAIVFPLIAEAQDGHYQWTASVGLEKGHATVCGSQDPRVIEIKNGLFKGADIVDGGTWTLPIRRLNADGSGRIVAYESRSKEENLFDFDAGIGPRPIRQTTNRGACVSAWMPMTADAAAAAAAEARKATWKAHREMVTGTDCGPPRDFSMEVRRGVLRIINDRGDVFTLADYSTGLKADGSGKLVAKSNSGDLVTWEFAAGQGPRAIKMTTNETTCVWRYQPR